VRDTRRLTTAHVGLRLGGKGGIVGGIALMVYAASY
jgi:hypothetical protein